MHFPTQLDKRIEFCVVVVPVTESDCILPQHYRGLPRASVVYEIKSNVTTLPAPVKVRIQHCVITEKGHSLVFMVAHDGPPYRFQPLRRGKFPRGESYGEIEVKKFCLVTIFYNIFDMMRIRMSLAVYEASVSNNIRHFLVTKNLPANCTQVKNEYKHAYLRSKAMTYSIRTNKISLRNLPIEEENGWHVKSFNQPASINMRTVHAYQPGCAIPKIELKREWKGAGEPKEKEFIIEVEGGDMESFTLFREQPPITPAPISHPLPQLTTPELRPTSHPLPQLTTPELRPTSHPLPQLTTPELRPTSHPLPQLTTPELQPISHPLPQPNPPWPQPTSHPLSRPTPSVPRPTSHPHPTPPEPPRPVAISDKPTLPLLQHLPTPSGGAINICQRIGVKNHNLGICLLEDTHGNITAIMDENYKGERKTKEIFRKWLEGTGRTPHSWATLVTVLREIEMAALAHEIEQNNMVQ